MRVLFTLIAVSSASLHEPVSCDETTDPDAGDYVHRGVSIRGGNRGVDGMYWQEGNSDVYIKSDLSWKMEWTGCSWAFGRAFVDANTSCVNDEEAADSFFIESDRDGNTCQAGAAAGFCAISYFKAVCAKACPGVDADDCHNDDNDAAADLASALELTQTTCSQLVEMCSLPSIRAVCKTTCKHDDHIVDSHLTGFIELGEFNAAYHRRLLRWGDHPGRDVNHARILAKDHEFNEISYRSRYVYYSPEEMLAQSGNFLINYPANFSVDYAYGCEQNPVDMNAAPLSVCDPDDMFSEVEGTSVAWSCIKLTGYDTVMFAYCPWINVDVPSDAELFAESCYDNKDRPGFDEDNANSNALCIPRERCEELCTAREACIGIDLVLGEDRCFLNRKHDDYCSEDETYDGAGGLSPPDGWYHPSGYGVNAGWRYPDQHIPSRKLKSHRRLVGTEHKLWASDSHSFLRKNTESDVIWVTSSDKYCRAFNVHVNETAFENKLCEQQPDNGGNASEGLDLDFVDSNGVRTGDVVICADRLECEDICKSIDECVSFDMHQTINRCWLNVANCTDDDLIHDGTEHDLVTKVKADACKVRITGAGAGMMQGDYFQDGVENFVHATGAYKIMYGDSGLGYFWAVMTNDETNLPFVITPQADPLTLLADGLTWDSWADAKLVHAACPDTGIEVLFKCLGDEMCQDLGYCMLSDERMSLEMMQFRGAEQYQQPFCDSRDMGEITAAIDSYRPKVIADRTRLEYVIDSNQFDGSTDAHFLHQEIYRDNSNFRIRLQSLGENFSQGLVTMVDPAASTNELGSVMAPPEGWRDWETDLIRFERFNQNGREILNNSFTFEMYTGSDTPVTLFLRTNTEWLAAGVGEDPEFIYTIEPSDLHHESGWWLVSVEAASSDYSDCSILIAGTKDIDECAGVPTDSPNDGPFTYTHGARGGVAGLYECEENAKCINLPGTYDCQCKDGFRLAEVDGVKECIATVWVPEALAVRVENDEDFDLGWRVQEIELFEDGACTKPVAENGKDWYWVQFEDTYCLGANAPASGAAASYACDSKCSATTTSGDCRGYKLGDTAERTALCVERQTCMDLCAGDVNCVGIDMHEYLPRCYLNHKNAADGADCNEQARNPELRMSDVHYDFWMKDYVVSITSASAFDHHPVSLVADGSMNSEWWSGTFRNHALTETIDFRVSTFAPVLGVKVHQKAGHSVGKYRVHVGPADRGVIDYASDYAAKHVQHAEAGATVEDRSGYTKSQLVTVKEGESPCVDLSCGYPILAWGHDDDVLQQIENVPSACHCKQLCIDQVDEGCRSYMHYEEADTNYWSDDAAHVHKSCYLFKIPFDASKGKASPFAISGGIDLVLHGASLDGDVLEVTGAGFPTQGNKQRIKIVKESCDEELSESVTGLSCSSSYVCHPPPASSDGDGASWKIGLKDNAAAETYKVCYCAGVCYSAGQWTMVPGVIKTGEAAHTFTSSIDTITKHVAPFTLTIDSTDADQDLVLIPAHELDCTDQLRTDHGALFTISHEGAGVHEVTVNGGASYGNYIACLDLDGTLMQVPSADGGPYVIVHPKYPEDAIRTQGIFKGAGSWSVKAGNTVDISIGGTDLDFTTFQTSRIAIAHQGNSCDEALKSNFKNQMHGISPTEDKSSESELVFETAAPEGLDAGAYSVCFCSDDDTGSTQLNSTHSYDDGTDSGCTYSELAGTLYVTRRVDTGKNFVIDPEAESSSIEITGENLNWESDRLMVVNCHDMCGAAGASDYVNSDMSWVSKTAMPDILDPKNEPGELPMETPYSVDALYMEIDNSYCRSNNIGTGADLLTSHLCHNKCADGCEGEGCFCDGFYQGFDTDESSALCLPRVECTHLCTLLGDECWGVDMHKTLNRCFLQGPGCQAQSDADQPADSFGFDKDYKLLVKPASGARRMTHVDWGSSHRGNLVLSPGVSTPYKLRFTDIHFAAAGTFKVCFCDSATGCASKSDFNIEVGKVHVSGVSCLLTEPKLRAVKCYEQYFGGLSCAEQWTEAPLESAIYPSSWSNMASP